MVGFVLRPLRQQPSVSIMMLDEREELWWGFVLRPLRQQASVSIMMLDEGEELWWGLCYGL